MDIIKFDQHFLMSKNVLLLESNLSQITSEDIIFEIGPGDGRLTTFLLEKKPKKVISIEKDKRFSKELEELKNKYTNFTYKFSNALDEIDNFKFNKLIANIPYSITEPLYKKILQKNIPFVLLLHGINFYKLIIDTSNRWHYYINSYYDVELIKEIPGNAFKPQAKTMSVLILLNKKKNLTDFEKFIQELFLKSKRNTANALIYTLVDSFNYSKKDAREIVDTICININVLNKPLENLSNPEFEFLIKNMRNLLKI